ncbi:TKL protein kinase [Saprolegnia diclina VS20]|uniref:TKL protein kinase n=1 Tax=Saprolegnia diclina (strain VS20) TaxID=1156394 RepID=T0PV09_SAPDV|nr:TKL protein kinase [Saprolegnia diclina VS20]EQC26081.1 TKL protein kinase [Saprolegnia diclina VS20]|eukprot:XP_008620448.1 TKL protein kinase [Saprolegnia diclina VS20]
MIASKNGHTTFVALIDQYQQARELVTAVSNGDKSQVGRLLANGVDPNTLDKDLDSVLLLAASAGHVGVANKLIKAGATVDTVFARGFAALHAAADQGHIAVITALLNAGADVNVRCHWGRTPLIFAAAFGKSGATQVLLAAGANANVVSHKGFSPLMRAAQDGLVKIMRLLLAHDANVNAVDERGFSPLLFAASCGHVDVVDQLLTKSANIDHQARTGMTAMHYAAESGRVGVVKRLLASGADASIPDKHGATALHVAVHNGYDEIVSALLAVEADVDAEDEDGWTPEMLAKTPALRKLFSDAKYPEAMKIADMMQAIKDDNVPVVLNLLAKGVDPNSANESGETLSHMAITHKKSSVLDVLLEADGIVHSKPNQAGVTPLVLAIRLGHYRLVNQIYSKVKFVTQQVTNNDVVYDENDALGAGAFGAVYKGSFQGHAVAIKCGNNKNALKAEIDAMLQCKSPYIVDLIAIADRFSEHPKLVLELMDGGSLDKHLEAKRLGKPTVVNYSNVEIAWVVAKALADLHHNGQVHRDLKSGNVLLSTTSFVKVCDLGIARDLDMNMTINMGTPFWTAPEVFKDDDSTTHGYGFAADIYSFGVILTELDTLLPPYASLSKCSTFDIMSRVYKGELRPTLSDTCQPWYSNLANKCLAFDPKDRPSANDIVTLLQAHLGEKNNALSTDAPRPLLHSSSSSSFSTSKTYSSWSKTQLVNTNIVCADCNTPNPWDATLCRDEDSKEPLPSAAKKLKVLLKRIAVANTKGANVKRTVHCRVCCDPVDIELEACPDCPDEPLPDDEKKLQLLLREIKRATAP